VPFAFEPEGYKLPSGFYCPDFWLPEQGVFVEIKPTKPIEEEETKAQELSLATGRKVFIFYGLPLDKGGIGFDSDGYTDTDFYFSECPTCGLVEIVWAGLINNLSCRCSTEGNPGNESSNLLSAAQLARQSFNRARGNSDAKKDA